MNVLVPLKAVMGCSLTLYATTFHTHVRLH